MTASSGMLSCNYIEMISPEDIKKEALRWWKPFLQSYISGEPFFPKQIDRIGKVHAGDVTNRFEDLQQEIGALYRDSKNEGGMGYLVKTSGKNFRRSGTHELPDCIVFETAEDYLNCIGKEKEWNRFTRNYALLIASLPRLREWILENALLLALPATNWQDILKVSQYFMGNPRPNMYIRQLPIKPHTKFIEENNTLLISILDYLLPEHIRNKDQKKLAERYFLKHDEPLIRIRILDESLAFQNKILDLSIPLSDFEITDWGCERVLIAENKMNFLTIPPVNSGISIWSGGGFNISYLRNASWLMAKDIYYWGDIDEHGFQLLHQIRSYYPDTRSLMMDSQTFEAFREFAVRGERNKAERLDLLEKEEADLYILLKSLEGNRLEQEKIPQEYVNAVFSNVGLI
jgi:hypothetical protein